MDIKYELTSFTRADLQFDIADLIRCEIAKGKISGGTQYIKKVGMLVENFEIDP